MTTKKRTTNREITPEEQSIAEILSADSNNGGITYGDIDSNTLRRLAHCATESGGSLTIWADRTNNRLCYSVRIGETARSYNADTPDQWSQGAESLIGKLTPALVKLKRKPPPAIK